MSHMLFSFSHLHIIHWYGFRNESTVAPQHLSPRSASLPLSNEVGRQLHIAGLVRIDGQNGHRHVAREVRELLHHLRQVPSKKTNNGAFCLEMFSGNIWKCVGMFGDWFWGDLEIVRFWEVFLRDKTWLSRNGGLGNCFWGMWFPKVVGSSLMLGGAYWLTGTALHV